MRAKPLFLNFLCHLNNGACLEIIIKATERARWGKRGDINYGGTKAQRGKFWGGGGTGGDVPGGFSACLDSGSYRVVSFFVFGFFIEKIFTEYSEIN